MCIERNLEYIMYNDNVFNVFWWGCKILVK